MPIKVENQLFLDRLYKRVMLYQCLKSWPVGNYSLEWPSNQIDFLNLIVNLHRHSTWYYIKGHCQFMSWLSKKIMGLIRFLGAPPVGLFVITQDIVLSKWPVFKTGLIHKYLLLQILIKITYVVSDSNTLLTCGGAWDGHLSASNFLW